MKYKVGDKVRVRRDLVEDQTYGCCSFIGNMTPLCNKIVTISRVHHEISRYQLTENLTGEYWTDEMLEDVEEEFKLPEKWCIKQCSDLMKWGKTTINRPDKEFDYDGSYYWPIGESLCYWDFGSKGVRKEITFDQFKKYVLKSESTPAKENKIVWLNGRWYRILNNWWGKFETIHNSGKRIKFSESITASGKYDATPKNIDLISEIELLTDLSEIQQYLPESHPDKIKRRTKKVEDLKYPDVVHCNSQGERDSIKKHLPKFRFNDWGQRNPWLLIGGGEDSGPYPEGTYIGYVNYEFSDIIFPEEEVVEKTDTKLSKEELLAEAKRRYPVGTKYKTAGDNSSDIFVLSSDDWSNSLLDDVVYAENGKGCLYYKGDWAEIISKPTVEEEVIDVPEYIECIKGFADYVIPGLIYKVIDKIDVYSVMLRCNITSSLPAGNNLYVGIESFSFKPSTKDAFDKQGKSVVEKKEELVQTGMSQSQACDSCKYQGEECAKRESCDATGGQHYPKEYIPEKYVSYKYDIIDFGSIGTANVRMPESVQWKMPRHIGISNSEEESPLDSSGDIIVKINKTEVKQIKL